MTDDQGYSATDLPAEWETPATRRTVEDLRRAYAAALPPPLRAATGRAVYRHMVARQRGRSTTPRRWLPQLLQGQRRGRAIVAALLAIALLSGATVYAAVSIFGSLSDQAFLSSGSLSGSGQVVRQNLGQQVSIARSACGYTMTVTRLYADANRVVIGYEIKEPPGRDFVFSNLALVDATGHDLHRLSGVGIGTRQSQSSALHGGYYAAFDAGNMPGGLALPLRLTAGLRVEQDLSDGLPPARPCETYLPAIPHSAGRGIVVNPPLRFDLRPPIDPRVRTVEPRQTVEAGGLPITLDHVVMTAAGTDLCLRLPPSLASADRTRLLLYTLMPGMQSGEDMLGKLDNAGPHDDAIHSDGSRAAGDQEIVSFNAPLYDKRGDWTFVARSFSADPQHVTAWTFHINIDPPTDAGDSTAEATVTATPTIAAGDPTATSATTPAITQTIAPRTADVTALSTAVPLTMPAPTTTTPMLTLTTPTPSVTMTVATASPVRSSPRDSGVTVVDLAHVQGLTPQSVIIDAT